MNKSDVVVYVSDDNLNCRKVLELVKEYEVSYKIKNITQNRDYMKEMQSNGIYGTPALFVKGERNSILGYQQERIRRALKNVEYDG